MERRTFMKGAGGTCRRRAGTWWRDAVAALSAHRRCIAPDFTALGFRAPRKTVASGSRFR
jgi:hypothetical protein